MKQVVYLQKVGDFDTTVLINLKKSLEHKFGDLNLEVELLPGSINLTNSQYDSKKGKYKAPKILRKLLKFAKKNNYFRVLGVLNKDIYSKNYKYIFGLARRGGSAALISLTRLREDIYRNSSVIYRKQETDEDFEQRILKEAIHELGHTLNLNHCQNSCVMFFSESLKDTDEKPEDFCEKCLERVKKFISKYDPSL
ncbi:MAG: archaemetzincin family Zn-dependent metalloprotease [Candidatus Thorarchaeota archaeon]